MLDDTRKETVSQTDDGEPDTKEAEALASALNHSAERVQTLWFSFLTFMLYLAIATGTTTHRMLFLEEQLNLPVLNIKLPLLGFYVLTPIIFVVFHFYMLLNLVLLARTARSLEDALVRAFPEDGECEAFRMRIENTLFAQLLAGGRLEREGFNAKFLSLMALITLALAPVALMLMLEIKFLPYHSEWITWLHRFLLLADIALVWTLWPGYRRQAGEHLWPKRSWWLVPAGALSAAALAYAVMVATFPDEQMYVATERWRGETGRKTRLDVITPINTLNLRGEDLINDAKLADILKKNDSSTDVPRWVATLSLAGRDLTGANLEDADVRHVDFSDATLNRAILVFAWAKNAQFNRAQLQGAHFDGVDLQGASLFRAQLQGASLFGAQLQSATLDGAQLQGAFLGAAPLIGAAYLQGATLDRAQLQGAWLDGAQFQGASLSHAQLQGASLDGAQLLGTSLDHAQLQGASFVGVCVWRADARQAAWQDTKVAHPEIGPKADKVHECDWTAARFEELKQHIAKEVPEGFNMRDAAMERIEQRLDPGKALEGEKEMAEIWTARERVSPAPEVYEKNVAGQWQTAGCSGDGAPYVLRALIAQLSFYSPFRDQSDAAKALARSFLDEANCAGARRLSEVAAPAAPQAPKP
jgi:uncharacterized protein YjbI with pentapeptide repeats